MPGSKSRASFSKIGEPRADRRIVIADLELASFVVPDAGEMPRELPRRDRPCLLRKIGDVALDRSVEVDLPLLDEQSQARRRQRLRHAADPQARRRRHGRLQLEVGAADRLAPHDPAVVRHRDRNAGGERAGHLVIDEGPGLPDRDVVGRGARGGRDDEKGRRGGRDEPAKRGAAHCARIIEIASKNFETSTMSRPWNTITLPAGLSTPGSIATTSALTMSLNRMRSCTGRATR